MKNWANDYAKLGGRILADDDADIWPSQQLELASCLTTSTAYLASIRMHGQRGSAHSHGGWVAHS
jgi:hypothetical protein